MSERFCDLPGTAKVYIVGIFCLPILPLVWATPHSHPSIFIWLAIIFALACLVKPIPHPCGGIIHSISGIIQVAGLLWEPCDTLLGVGVGCLLGGLAFRRIKLWRTGVDAAGWAMGALAASIVAHLTLAGIVFFPLSLVLAAILSGGARFLTNQLIFSGYRSLRFGHPFLPHLRSCFASGLVGELFPMPLIIILTGMAFLLPSTAWRLVITAAYLTVLPIPRRGRDNYAEAVSWSQTTMAMTTKIPWNSSAVLKMGARILSAAEFYDNTCEKLSPALRSAVPEAVECQLATRAEYPSDPLVVSVVSIVVSVGKELKSALASKSA